MLGTEPPALKGPIPSSSLTRRGMSFVDLRAAGVSKVHVDQRLAQLGPALNWFLAQTPRCLVLTSSAVPNSTAARPVRARTIDAEPVTGRCAVGAVDVAGWAGGVTTVGSTVGG